MIFEAMVVKVLLRWWQEVEILRQNHTWRYLGWKRQVLTPLRTTSDVAKDSQNDWTQWSWRKKCIFKYILWWQIADCNETSSLVLYLAKVQSEPHLIRIILALANSGHHLKVLIKCLKKSKKQNCGKNKILDCRSLRAVSLSLNQNSLWFEEKNHLPQSAASPFLPRLVGHMGITFEQ